MMYEENVRYFKMGSYEVWIDVVETNCGCNWLDELYYRCERNEGGVTIRVPSQYGDGYFQHHAYTPAELASEYAKQGRENPSKEAYKSMQDELGWYITADDCYLRCTIKKAGIEIAEVAGIGFDYSAEYADDDLAEYARKHMLPDYGADLIHDTITEARSVLQRLAA